MTPALTSLAAPTGPGHFDELLDETGSPRPHWQAFVRHAGDLGPEHLMRQQARVERQIRENGVTYNVYASPAGPARPWAVDVLPAIIPAAEWGTLAAGLGQRARLLNAMAADVYGEQRLVAEGLLPPALVYGHRGFLRPCHGIKPPGGVFLHLVAFDVAHGPDGQWRVVGTRAQAPSGAGYALENRLIIRRLFPDAFRELRVHMVAQFFRALQETLLGSATTDGETPHVVLLTPGPYNETYFEHAYLARYLGFTLAEGADLTVRDDRVHLKTLTGLKRVHVILRRLDDDFCDPLELRADSTLGVPGLVQAWRAGHVVVANALGTGMLESAGLLPYLPSASARLLGEPLAIPSVDTWWGGEAAALEQAARDPAALVIKPVFPDTTMEPVFVGVLDRAKRAEWLARVRAAPERYALQRYLPLSQVPAWHDGRLERRGLLLRVFLVADGRGDYQTMPGGLARIAGREDRQVVSGHRGGSTKDTWVLSEAPVERFSLLPGTLRLEDIQRSQRAVSSRAGESLFWLGRYAERSENGARLLRAVLMRLPDADAFPARFHRPVIQVCRRLGLLPRTDEAGAGTPQALERELIAAMFDRVSSLGLAYNVEQTARVAGAVRDRLSLDNWRIVNQLFQGISAPGARTGLDEALDVIDRTIVGLVAVGGLETEHMTRDDGWRFLSLGRYMERLMYVATTVREVAAGADAREPALLDWLLDLSDSTITYRARYMREPEWLAVADLLLFDWRNPRSAAFQLAKLAAQLGRLPEADLAELAAETEAAMVVCRAAQGTEGDHLHQPEFVARLLRDWERLGHRLSDAVALRYFSHVYESTHATWVI